MVFEEGERVRLKSFAGTVYTSHGSGIVGGIKGTISVGKIPHIERITYVEWDSGDTSWVKTSCLERVSAVELIAEGLSD